MSDHDTRKEACLQLFIFLTTAHRDGLVGEVLSKACRDLCVDPVRLCGAVRYRYQRGLAEHIKKAVMRRRPFASASEVDRIVADVIEPPQEVKGS